MKQLMITIVAMTLAGCNGCSGDVDDTAATDTAQVSE